jgi:hypothetical protein
MRSAQYYHGQATILRRLATKVTDEGVLAILSEILRQTAKDYEEIAEDLEIAEDAVWGR